MLTGEAPLPTSQNLGLYFMTAANKWKSNLWLEAAIFFPLICFLLSVPNDTANRQECMPSNEVPEIHSQSRTITCYNNEVNESILLIKEKMRLARFIFLVPPSGFCVKVTFIECRISASRNSLIHKRFTHL